MNDSIARCEMDNTHLMVYKFEFRVKIVFIRCHSGDVVFTREIGFFGRQTNLT